MRVHGSSTVVSGFFLCAAITACVTSGGGGTPAGGAGGSGNNVGTSGGSAGAAVSSGGGAGTLPVAGTGGGTGTGGGPAGCAVGTIECSGACVNPLASFANCGGCGLSCSAGENCVNGACQCANGFVDCGGTCVESNAQNCGSCGNVCAAGLVCSQGQCTAGCGPGLSPCDGSCFDLTGHRNHCGSCTTVCAETQDCWQGMCRCPEGQDACDGSACQDVLSDEQNCGECDNVCPQGATCTGGVCQCPGGQTACSNGCKDLSSDEQNCGSCGNVCNGTTQCLSNGCVDPTSVNCGGGSHTANKCNNGDNNIRGKYWINNNHWGASGSSGTQCIWNTCTSGDLVGWGTNWNWSGQPNSVKSFSSLVFGWHWGWMVENTGLPLQISSSANINCGWQYTVTLGGGTDTMNVAYDMWVHTTSNPNSNSMPTDEIMVWLYRNNGAGPVGGKTNSSTINIGGHPFDLYEGFTTLNVFSFVRQTNATTAVLNMMDFPRYLVSQGKMSNSKYISSVQAGPEVFIGEATVETNGFYCRIQ